MTPDIDFQIESYHWIRSTHGPEYLATLAHRIAQEGPAVVLAEVIQPTMSDDAREVYRAAIEYISNLPIPTLSG